MNNFTPYPGKIEIKTIERDGVILSDTTKYEEMGEVIQVGEGVDWLKVGDIVFFLAYGLEQTPDYQGQVHYVVPANDKFIIGKCTTNEASASMDTSTTIAYTVSGIGASASYVVGATTSNTSPIQSPTESISDTTSEKP